MALYVNGRSSAAEVAEAIGPPWSALDIYRWAAAICEKRGIERVYRHRERVDVDWLLVHEMRADRVPWVEIGEMIGRPSGKLKSLYHHHRQNGLFDEEPKAALAR